MLQINYFGNTHIHKYTRNSILDYFYIFLTFHVQAKIHAGKRVYLCILGEFSLCLIEYLKTHTVRVCSCIPVYFQKRRVCVSA